MKKVTIVAKINIFLLAGLVLLTSCASSTVIKSTPSGAKIYIDQEYKGVTPYTHKDSKIVGSTTTVKLSKEKFETKNTSFSRDEEVNVGAVIGGIFFLVPLLWVMKYKPTHTYELKPDLGDKKPINKGMQLPINSLSRIDRLYELKKLLDEKIITQEEFNTEKKKILSEEKN